MRKSKKRKNYDIYISPGKRYLYRTRKILFLLSMTFFILNMSIIAVLVTSMKKTALISILLSSVFTVLQLVDNRKANWDWSYIIFLCVMFHFVSGLCAFFAELFFMGYIWAGELILISVFIGLSLYKRDKR